LQVIIVRVIFAIERLKPKKSDCKDQKACDDAQIGTYTGAAVGTAASVVALAGAGAGPVGLATIGATVGGGMAAGATAVVAAPVVAAVAIGGLVYWVSNYWLSK